MELLLKIEILQYLKDPKLWELWSIPPYCGKRRIYIINRSVGHDLGPSIRELRVQAAGLGRVGFRLVLLQGFEPQYPETLPKPFATFPYSYNNT